MVTIAALKGEKVINVYNYANKPEAKEFFAKGAFGDADDFIELKDGFFIGDIFIEGAWKKKPETSELEKGISPAGKSLNLPEVTNYELMMAIIELSKLVENLPRSEAV